MRSPRSMSCHSRFAARTHHTQPSTKTTRPGIDEERVRQLILAAERRARPRCSAAPTESTTGRKLGRGRWTPRGGSGRGPAGPLPREDDEHDAEHDEHARCRR